MSESDDAMGEIAEADASELAGIVGKLTDEQPLFLDHLDLVQLVVAKERPVEFAARCDHPELDATILASEVIELHRLGKMAGKTNLSAD